MSKATVTSACSGGEAKGCCTPEPDVFDSLQAIVDDYRAGYEPRVAAEKQYFGDKSQPLARIVERAALSLWPNGDIHDHQRRPGKAAMRACAAALAGHEQALGQAADFAALHSAVGHILNADGGKRPLIVYDIAERIGSYLGLEPNSVYLHRGARDGAEVLWPGIKARTIEVAAFPQELQSLSAAHLENLLCIYKRALASLKRRGLL